jgi:hypothetical protein
MSKATFFVILFLAAFLGVFFYETLQEYPKVDVLELKLFPNHFEGMKVKTRGFAVLSYPGLKLVELQPISFSEFSAFPIFLHFSGSQPPEGSYIEVRGVVTHRNGAIEGLRDYFIDVDSWSYSSTGIEIISDTATLSVILALLLLLFALGKLVFSVLMHKRLKKALTSKNYGFEYD